MEGAWDTHMWVRVGSWVSYLFISITYIDYQSNKHLQLFKKSGWKYLKLMDQIIPDGIPWGRQVFTPSLAPVPASGSTTMDIFNSFSSQVGLDTLVKSSSVIVPVAVEGLIKDVFTYPSSSQASFNVLTNPTDNMQINHDQHIACSPPSSPLISSCMSKWKRSALEVPKAPSLSGHQTSPSPSAQSLPLPSMSSLSGIHSSSKPFISTSQSDDNSQKKVAQVWGCKPKSSSTTSITDEISVLVILQTISSQMT